jgi:hypothetical protein
MPVAEAWELSVNRDEIPPGTLYLLILETVALHREVQGCRLDPKRLGIVLQGGEHSLGAITRVIQTA